jgi:transposase-like protein
MNVEYNGVCPACHREDSVKEREPRELFSRERHQRFECGGCEAKWCGVRYPTRHVHHHRPIGLEGIQS